MITYELSFGKVILIQDDIAEVIVDEGVEFDIVMVGEYHEFLIDHLKHPFSLLINKLHSYSYTFEAQQYLGDLTEINAMAVVSYTKASEITTKSLASMPKESTWDLKIFKKREIALKWLEVKQAIIGIRISPMQKD